MHCHANLVGRMKASVDTELGVAKLSATLPVLRRAYESRQHRKLEMLPEMSTFVVELFPGGHDVQVCMFQLCMLVVAAARGREPDAAAAAEAMQRFYEAPPSRAWVDACVTAMERLDSTWIRENGEQRRCVSLCPSFLLTVGGNAATPGISVGRVSADSETLPRDAAIRVEAAAIRILKRAAKLMSTSELMAAVNQHIGNATVTLSQLRRCLVNLESREFVKKIVSNAALQNSDLDTCVLWAYAP
jgi:hypothetical protein